MPRDIEKDKFTKLSAFDLNNDEHVLLMYEVRCHPEVDKFLSSNPPKSLAEHVLYLNRSIKDYEKNFYIIETFGDPAGYCQITKTDDHAELGWAIHPDRQGFGFGTVAIQRLIEETKSLYGDDIKIVLYVKPSNVKALNLYLKHGFKIERVSGASGEFLMSLNYE